MDGGMVVKHDVFCPGTAMAVYFHFIVNLQVQGVGGIEKRHITSFTPYFPKFPAILMQSHPRLTTNPPSPQFCPGGFTPVA